MEQFIIPRGFAHTILPWGYSASFREDSPSMVEQITCNWRIKSYGDGVPYVHVSAACRQECTSNEVEGLMRNMIVFSEIPAYLIRRRFECNHKTGINEANLHLPNRGDAHVRESLTKIFSGLRRYTYISNDAYDYVTGLAATFGNRRIEMTEKPLGFSPLPFVRAKTSSRLIL